MRLLYLFLVLTALLAGSVCWAHTAPHRLESLFLQDKKWTGSDGAYSIDIGNGKAVWLFSDTFIGPISAGKRKNNDLINNSIGIQDLNAGKMSFFWKGKEKPGSFFPGGRGYWLWLGDGVFYKNKVYCFAKRVSAIPGQEGEPFGFTWKRDELIVIENPADDPSKWQCRHLLLPFTTETIHFGTACCLDNEMLYLMGLNEAKKETILARIPLKELQALNLTAFEFFSTVTDGNPKWSNNASNCKSLFDHSAAEASITKIGKKYLCIFHSDGAGARIVARTAENLAGPWSEELLLYTVPDALLKRGLCYAAKAHPEQRCKKGSIIVTYLINPGKLTAHDKDPYAYFPKVVELKIP